MIPGRLCAGYEHTLNGSVPEAQLGTSVALGTVYRVGFSPSGAGTS